MTDYASAKQAYTSYSITTSFCGGAVITLDEV